MTSMTENPKVIDLVVNKKVEDAAPIELEITMGAQVKYADSEVVLVRTYTQINGEMLDTNHLIVKTPKE